MMLRGNCCVGSQRFGAGIENAAVRAGAAHHRRIDIQRAVIPGCDAGSDLHAIVVDVSAEPMFGCALQLAQIFQVRRAAGRNYRRIEAVRAHAGERFIIEALRVGPAALGRIQHEARKGETLRLGDFARQRDIPPAAPTAPLTISVASTTTVEADAQAAPGCQAANARTDELGRELTLLFICNAPSRAIFVADQVVADQDILDPRVRHHLGFAEFLAGDALRAGGDLQLRQRRILCVLICGRLAISAASQAAWMRAMLRSTRSMSITAAGVPYSRAIFAARGVVMSGIFNIFAEHFEIQPFLFGRLQFFLRV